MRILRTFSFKENEKELLEHIDKQENKSEYIKKLIKQDMYESKLPNELKALIQEYIQKNINEFK